MVRKSRPLNEVCRRSCWSTEWVGACDMEVSRGRGRGGQRIGGGTACQGGGPDLRSQEPSKPCSGWCDAGTRLIPLIIRRNLPAGSSRMRRCRNFVTLRRAHPGRVGLRSARGGDAGPVLRREPDVSRRCSGGRAPSPGRSAAEPGRHGSGQSGGEPRRFERQPACSSGVSSVRRSSSPGPVTGWVTLAAGGSRLASGGSRLAAGTWRAAALGARNSGTTSAGAVGQSILGPLRQGSQSRPGAGGREPRNTLGHAFGGTCPLLTPDRTRRGRGRPMTIPRAGRLVLSVLALAWPAASPRSRCGPGTRARQRLDAPDGAPQGRSQRRGGLDRQGRLGERAARHHRDVAPVRTHDVQGDPHDRDDEHRRRTSRSWRAWTRSRRRSASGGAGPAAPVPPRRDHRSSDPKNRTPRHQQAARASWPNSTSSRRR